MNRLTIDVWYGDRQSFGHFGTPSLAVNILGRVSSPHGVHAMAYQLNRGRQWPLPLGPTAYRLLRPGDFNVELSRELLRAGENDLLLRAVDQAGNEASRTVSIEFTPERACELPMSVRWSEASAIQDVAQVVDGHWRLDGDGLRTVDIGYDRLVALGDVTWRDYMITAEITIHGFTDLPAAYTWPSHGAIVGLLARWKRHVDWHDIMPSRGYLPHGAIGYVRYGREKPNTLELFSGADGSTLARCEAPVFELGETLIFKLAVRTTADGPGEYRFKVWRAAGAEPADWSIQAVNLPGELDGGAAMLLAHHTDATFGDVRIEPL